MKARSGQVALYLAFVLVAIVVLMLMNVGTFITVRAKNRQMNAVDAAAIAAANYQGELLNEVGRMNVRHLKAAVYNEPEGWTEEDAFNQRDLVMFGPVECLERAQNAARTWGLEGGSSTDVAQALQSHVGDILSEYVNNPDLYPQYREGQWTDYAARLSAQLSGGLIISPALMESANASGVEPVYSQGFYEAIASRNWWWFATGGRRSYFNYDSSSMPRPQQGEREVQENSEIYPLHVTFKTWLESEWGDDYVVGVGFSQEWTNFVCEVTGCTEGDIRRSLFIGDLETRWAFYDHYWVKWSTYLNPSEFPVAGSVKEEYDVGGAFASALAECSVPTLWNEGSRSLEVTAEAKPLGENVLRYRRFVATDAADGRIFTEAQLIPMGSVPHAYGVILSPQWYRHVREHLPAYFESGPHANGCSYCAQLVWWESASNRSAAREWLLANPPPTSTGSGIGGGGHWSAH